MIIQMVPKIDSFNLQPFRITVNFIKAKRNHFYAVINVQPSALMSNLYSAHITICNHVTQLLPVGFVHMKKVTALQILVHPFCKSEF